MVEKYTRSQKQLKDFFSDYGKVLGVTILFLLCIISVYLIFSCISPKKLVVSFLDVGQGDAILIQTPSGKTMLVDGGASDVVLSRLSKKLSYFDTTIDVIVATHADTDHVTGLIPVLKKYSINNVVMSPVEGGTGIFQDMKKHIDDEGSAVYVAKKGDIIDFQDGVIAKMLYPPERYRVKSGDTNSGSVSMVITYKDQDFLLTGDLPSGEEPKLISSGLEKDVTVYKAGHHGSKTSSGEQLLSYIKPEYAVVSAGKDNRYGHPDTEALTRLETYSKEVLTTIDRGTISFITDGRMMEVKTEK